MAFDNKTVLVTGGLGSFGQKFVETILKEHNPKSVRIFDNRELAQVEAERKLKDPRLRFFIGDVRDKDRLKRAMNGVDIVVHAAALKHVPVCEYNPIEAVKTNIGGAINVVDAAIDCGVEKVIDISTDKTVQPINLYGATKLVAEKLFIQGNNYSGGHKTMFSCVRYGNLTASSGSVIPLFLEQKNKGELTVTDERMTRFWITLEQGVNFVIDYIEKMKGGEVFIPKIPSTKIIDLARVIAPEAKIKIIGMRSGEKYHEILLSKEEAKHTREFDKYFIIEPEFGFWRGKEITEGKSLPEDFEYSSDNNTEWLSDNDLKKMIYESKINN
jgi:UDP-N-acetylglucosamine 4,6-dehydratase/5-epimerase